MIKIVKKKKQNFYFCTHQKAQNRHRCCSQTKFCTCLPDFQDDFASNPSFIKIRRLFSKSEFFSSVIIVIVRTNEKSIYTIVYTHLQLIVAVCF